MVVNEGRPQLKKKCNFSNKTNSQFWDKSESQSRSTDKSTDNVNF